MVTPRTTFGRPLATALAASLLLIGCGTSGRASESAHTTTSDATSSRATTTDTEGSTEAGPTTTAIDDEGRGDIIPDDEASGPTTDLMTVADPVNQAFDVGVPVGWDNLVYSTVDGQMHREVVNAVSPDGATVVFLGDPKLPSYWNPDTANEITWQMAEWLDTMEIAYYDPAPSYFETYVRDKFEQLEGFEFISIEENVVTEQSIAETWADAGLQPQNIDVADVRFRFADGDGKATEAILTGTTINSGDFWQVDVVGIASTGSPDDYLGMLQAMAQSKKTRQSFIDSQNARHQQVMADIQARTEEMTRQHERNMQWIQDSANAHQQRMEAIWAANDASVASFYDRMASGDVEQRQFLNYINDESTVQSSGGQKFQVDNSYQRYWLNPSTGEYAGGDIDFGEQQLRDLGLDPGSYEEVEIVKG